jgi:uncharacterized membrane protein YeaQ/YmgE (transglycosylase-associated protein family)
MRALRKRLRGFFFVQRSLQNQIEFVLLLLDVLPLQYTSVQTSTGRQRGGIIMGWIIAIIVGGIAGWLASKVMNRDASMGIMWNVVAGCVGSVVGNLIANQFGIVGSVQQFSITGLVVAFVGAIIVLAILNLVQRGRVR